MWVPVPPSAEAALAGATVLVNLSGSPITVGRAEDRASCWPLGVLALPGRLRLRRRGRGRVDHRPVLGRPDAGLRERRAARRVRALPEGAGRAVADVDLLLLRQERLRLGTFDDNRRTHAVRVDGVPDRRVHAGPAGRRPRAAPPRRALPVRAGRRRPAGAGLLRGLQHPGLRPGAAAARDRAPEGRHRGLRRAGLHPRADRRGPGDGPAGPPAQRHPGVHPARLRHQRAHEEQRDRAVAGPRRHVRGDRHHRRPRGRCSPRLDHPFAAGEAGLRRHVRERPGRAAHRLPVPAGQPARRHRARHRRPVRAGAGLVAPTASATRCRTTTSTAACRRR